MSIERFCLVALALMVLALGCTKTNTVERNVGPDQEPAENNDTNNGEVGEIGDQCDSESDTGCGVASRCVLGFCRFGCTNDAECPRGSICIGTEPPFGCALEEELNCQGAADCDLGLTCGLDNKCRHPCAEDANCPRNEHVCIADACVSQNEGDFDKWDFPCTRGNMCCVLDEGNVRAGGDGEGGGLNCIDPPGDGFVFEDDGGDQTLVVCNIIGPGWQVLDDGCSTTTCSGGRTNYCREHYPLEGSNNPNHIRGDECVVKVDEENLPVCGRVPDN